MIRFDLLKCHDRARTGRLVTEHGDVETPAFMPVGTAGSVKGVTPRDLRDCGAQIVLSNVYHLFLRPGVPAVEELGGLHRFMGWSGPLLTDSGGYQVFSLGALVKVREEGVEFKSHLDGSRHLLRPEDVVSFEIAMGVDIGMVLDVCLPPSADSDDAERAVRQTTEWAARSLEARGTSEQALFGIVQGASNPELRDRSAREILALGFDGYAIGGLSVGENPATTRRVASHSIQALPKDRPRYLMGLGRPVDLLDFITMGYDLFDCVLPTRNGRNGGVFTRRGRFSVRNARYARDSRPLDEECGCHTCRHYSRGYLRHLAVTGEMLSGVLNSIHNLQFYLDLMRSARRSIENGSLGALRAEIVAAYPEDEVNGVREVKDAD